VTPDRLVGDRGDRDVEMGQAALERPKRPRGVVWSSAMSDELAADPQRSLACLTAHKVDVVRATTLAEEALEAG